MSQAHWCRSEVPGMPVTVAAPVAVPMNMAELPKWRAHTQMAVPGWWRCRRSVAHSAGR